MDADLLSPDEFTVAERVQAHPATDAFMAGDRYGIVTKLGRRYVHVRMTASGRTRRFLPADLLHTPATS